MVYLVMLFLIKKLAIRYKFFNGLSYVLHMVSLYKKKDGIDVY